MKTINPDEYDSHMWTPLMHVVEDGDMERFEALVAAGAGVNVGYLEGECYPITIAAEYGQDELFFRLVELGADLTADIYCCPTCDMWYGFNKADLFAYAMESGSIRIARFLRFLGVRPWSRMRSMNRGGQTLLELATDEKARAFLAAVFTPAELRSKKTEVNVFEWLGWKDMQTCRDVFQTNDSGYWPVAVCLPKESCVFNYGRNDQPDKQTRRRVYTARAYYAVRLWEEARRHCVERGIDADAEAVWFNAAPTHRLVRYGNQRWDKWDRFVSAMYDELERIADSGELSVHSGRNVPPPGADATNAKIRDYVVPNNSDRNMWDWRDEDLEAIPMDGLPVSFSWKEICRDFVRLTPAQVSFLHAEQMARFEDKDEALFKACYALDVPAMETAIQAGANVFACNQYGDTAVSLISEGIMEAEIEDNLKKRETGLQNGRQAFQCIVEHGGSIDFAGVGGNCPIYDTGHGYPQLLEILLDLGADSNTPSWFEPGESIETALQHTGTDSYIHGDEDGTFARVERMLYRAGGMYCGFWNLDNRNDLDNLEATDSAVPQELFPDDMPIRDRRLVQAVRRGWEYHATLAVRWGADPTLRDERGRNLVRIFLEDYETYRQEDSETTPAFVANFTLFLLRGIRVPANESELRTCLDICRSRGYEECAVELNQLIQDTL